MNHNIKPYTTEQWCLHKNTSVCKQTSLFISCKTFSHYTVQPFTRSTRCTYWRYVCIILYKDTQNCIAWMYISIFAFLTVYRVYRVRENVYRDKYKSMCRQNRISVIVCLEKAINVYLSNQRLLHNVCITYQNVKQLYIVHWTNLIATCWLFLVLNKIVLLNRISCLFACRNNLVSKLVCHNLNWKNNSIMKIADVLYNM